MNLKPNQMNSDGSLSAAARRWLIVSLLSILGCPSLADCPGNHRFRFQGIEYSAEFLMVRQSDLLKVLFLPRAPHVLR